MVGGGGAGGKDPEICEIFSTPCNSAANSAAGFEDGMSYPPQLGMLPGISPGPPIAAGFEDRMSYPPKLGMLPGISPGSPMKGGKLGGNCMDQGVVVLPKQEM